MRRSLASACLTVLFASALGLTACTPAGGGRGGRAVPADAGDAGDAGDAEPDDASAVTPDAKAPLSAATAACAEVATARCTRSSKCTGGVATKAHDTSIDACIGRVTAECEEATSFAAFDAAAAKGCVAAIGAQSCAALVAGVTLAECVLHGTRLKGAPCGRGEQCDTGYCAKSPASACGQCAAPPEAGHACAAPADCGDRGDLSCVRSLCTPFEEKGQQCSVEDRCGPGLTCATPDGGTFARCVDAPVLDEPCAPAGAAESTCAASLGLYCSSAGRGARTNLARTGQPCGALDMGRTECNAGAVCVLTSGSATGTCRPPVGEGGACDPAAGSPCASPGACVVAAGDTSGRCTVVNPSRCF
jgi:hypothetical protein